MKPIKVSVTGHTATVTQEQLPVSGTVGLPVEFTFDEVWTGLEKTAVFRVDGKTMDRLNVARETTVPWELLQKTGCMLYCGVFGCNADGSLQIPTVWVELGVIQSGADPCKDENANPSLPVWQQLTEDVEKALDAIIEIQMGLNSGQMRPSGL